jgi:putative nucleotidyltransferase with HDIG domain
MRAKRWQLGPIGGVVLSLFAAAALVGIATADLFLMPKVSSEAPLMFSVRIPAVGIYKNTITGGASYKLHSLKQAPGKPLAAEHARLVQAYEDLRRPPSTVMLTGLVLGSLMMFLLFTAYLRSRGRGRLLRTQVALVGALLVVAAIGKVLLMFTDWSAIWFPVAALVLPVCIMFDRRSGGAVAIAGAFIGGILNPIDLPLILVLTMQGFTVAAIARPGGGRLLLGGSALAASIAGLMAYIAMGLLMVQYVPLGALGSGQAGLSDLLRSDLVASFAGPMAAGLFAMAIFPLLQRAVGHVSRARLMKLAQFEHPLLKRLSSRAPGTWAHSLNMANIAEMAANAIGADGLLTRVGAYYHDLGKSVEPQYFIENQTGQNPHDEMPPAASADAIFAHVTGGVELARKHKIPETVVEFLYTHHADDRLEYFWHKLQHSANRGGLSEKDFRYPGMRPQTRETGILSLCDAVEAASRTLKNPQVEDIRKLVQQIVFTRLEKGLLDESGLSVEDLRKASATMVEALRSAMHGRVKYPWQEEDEEKAEKEQQESAASQSNPGSRPAEKVAATSSSEAIVVEEEVSRPAASRLNGKQAIQTKTASRPMGAVRRKKAVKTDGPALGTRDAKEPAWVDSPEIHPERQRVSTRPLGTKLGDEESDVG